MSAEQTVRIDSSPTSPIFTQPATALPSGGQVYTTLIENVASVNGTLNLLSIFNPLGSGKTMIFAQFVCFPYANASTTTTTNMDVFRISAASGGSLLAAANINKFVTTETNSIAEVRTGNPTITVVGTVPILAIPPAITTTGAGASAQVQVAPPGGALFTCLPGEGIGARVTAATTGQSWSLGFSWTEV